MAEYGPVGETLTLKAVADMTAQYHHFVRLSAADTINVASNAADQATLGVLISKPAAANRHAAVQVSGKVKIVAGGSVTVNDLITTNGSGRATAANSGHMVMGRALQGASNDGEVITMLLQPYFNGNIS